MPKYSPIEVAIDSFADCRNASAAGADRLELCDRLDLGGLTPPRRLVEAARLHFPEVPLVLMARTPGDDEAISSEVVRLLAAEIRDWMSESAAGIIFGFTREGRIDRPACAALLAAAPPIPCVFHRAFDTLPDPVAALEEIIALGFRRVLTSGGSGTVSERVAALERLVDVAAGRIEILPGGGLRAENAAAIRNTQGILWVHSSCRSAADPARFSADEFARLREALSEVPKAVE